MHLRKSRSHKAKVKRAMYFSAFTHTCLMTQRDDDSHRLLLLFLLVADDVRLAVLVDGNCSTLDPHAQDVGSTLVLARLHADGVQLLLEVLDALGLLRHLHLVLAIHDVHKLLCFVLVAHLRLPSPSLAARLQDVDTTTLGCCAQRRDINL